MCKISVDGTDFKIYEPTPFDPKWYSHKFKGPGLRYEVGLNIQTGDLVWLNGPFPCGRYPDGVIATREGLEECLDAGEKYVCDGGYYGPRAVKPNGLNNADQHMKSVVRARHETVNRRFKQFGILEHVFRHRLQRHGVVVWAIANITQIGIEDGTPLFQVVYDDRTL